MNKVGDKTKGLSMKGISTWLSYLTVSVQLVIFCLVISLPRSADCAVFNVPFGNEQALIDAINMANANDERDTINLESNVSEPPYVLTAVDNNINGPNGLPSITSDITINGEDEPTLIVRNTPGPNFRIFHVAEGGILTLNELSVQGGSAVNDPDVPDDGNGGDIINFGTLNVVNCNIASGVADLDGGGISNFGTLNISNSEIEGNFAGRRGGGVHNASGSGTVTITNSAIGVVGQGQTQNSASSGGGIFNGSITPMLIINSTIFNNLASGAGGGISNSGTLIITNSAIISNAARATNIAVGGGGGIQNSGVVTITNSTLSGNLARSSGGGILNFGIEGSSQGDTNMNNVTIAFNQAVDSGGGIAEVRIIRTFNLKNTIIANNSTTSGVNPDCSVGGPLAAPLNSQGNNLIENVSGCEIEGDQTGNIIGIDPLLSETLSFNGGLTLNHALRPDSPAIDAGNPATPGSSGSNNACEFIDQRIFVRPTDGDADGTAVCDIGAFEFSSSTPLTCAGFTVTIPGTLGDDVINGTNDRDVIHGLGGNDTINGLRGNDIICGGEGNDTLNGGIGRDRLFGQGGVDILNGNSETDLLYGGTSNDTLNGHRGDDYLNGGAGDDSCDGGAHINGDTATGCETVTNVP